MTASAYAELGPIGAVGLIAEDVALADPCELVAVTRTVMAVPSSAPCSVYEVLVAPEIFVPSRRHWYVKVGVGKPLQVPEEAPTVSPVSGVPSVLMTGADA